MAQPLPATMPGACRCRCISASRGEASRTRWSPPIQRQSVQTATQPWLIRLTLVRCPAVESSLHQKYSRVRRRGLAWLRWAMSAGRRTQFPGCQETRCRVLGVVGIDIAGLRVDAAERNPRRCSFVDDLFGGECPLGGEIDDCVLQPRRIDLLTAPVHRATSTG